MRFVTCLLLTTSKESQEPHREERPPAEKMASERELDLLTRQIQIAERRGEKRRERDARSKLGHYLRSRGEYKEAKKQYEKALVIDNHIGLESHKVSATIVGGLANCAVALGQYPEGIEHSKTHLKISREMGDKTEHAIAVGNLGKCYLGLGEYEKALAHIQMQLRIAKEIGNKPLGREAILSLGVHSGRMSQHDKAIAQLKVLVKFAREAEDRSSEAAALGNMGNCYNALGKYGKAIEHLEMQLKIGKDTGRKSDKADTAGRLGCLYYNLGQFEKAIQYDELQLKIAKEIGNRSTEGYAYNGLGVCYNKLGHYARAVEYHKRRLEIARENGDKESEEFGLGNLGNCFLNLGQYGKAIQHLEAQLKIATEIGEREGEEFGISRLGHCYNSLGQHDKATEKFPMALKIAKEIKDIRFAAHTYRDVGETLRVVGQHKRAEQCFKESVRLLNELFKTAPKDDELKTSLLDTFVSAYTLLIETLLLQDKTSESLVTADEMRSRALCELLVERSARSPQATCLDRDAVFGVIKALDSTLIYYSLLTFDTVCTWIPNPKKNNVSVRPRGLMTPLAYFLRRLIAQTSMTVVQTVESLRLLVKLLIEVRSTRYEDRSLSFLYSAERAPRVSTRREHVDKLSAFPTLTEVHNTENHDAVGATHSAFFVWNVQSTLVPLLRSLLSDLYQTLISPVREEVQGSQVVIVPYGQLALVPFAALIDGDGHFVAESLEVRLVPSLATAKMIMERPLESSSREATRSRFLILGDPDVGYVRRGEEKISVSRLRFANQEVEMVGKLLSVEPLTGDAATKERFLHDAEYADLIHIASHGDVERGEILLASGPGSNVSDLEDVMLRLSDLKGQRLRAKLVVLSCCYSGVGDVKSEGVIGIGRAFLGAGARAVLVSLWAVDDEATMCFMKTFYEHLICGETASKALGNAMRTMRQSVKFSDPLDWGSFVLIGENVVLFEKWQEHGFGGHQLRVLHVKRK